VESPPAFGLFGASETEGAAAVGSNAVFGHVGVALLLLLIGLFLLRRAAGRRPEQQPAQCRYLLTAPGPNIRAAAMQTKETTPVVRRTCQSSGYIFIRLSFAKGVSGRTQCASAAPLLFGGVGWMQC